MKQNILGNRIQRNGQEKTPDICWLQHKRLYKGSDGASPLEKNEVQDEKHPRGGLKTLGLGRENPQVGSKNLRFGVWKTAGGKKIINSLMPRKTHASPFTKISISKEGIIKKISYERPTYESMDEKSLGTRVNTQLANAPNKQMRFMRRLK